MKKRGDQEMKIIRRDRLVVLLITICVLAFGSNARGENEPSGVVMSVVPETFLSSVLAADVQYEDVNLRGVRFWLDRNKKRVGSVRIGIFSDTTKAREMINEALLFSPVGPDKDISGKIGNNGVAWEGRVLFRRDNVLVDLRLPDVEIQRRAIQIDAVLSKGGIGVTRDSVVEVPRLLDIEMEGDKPKGKLLTERAGYTAFIDKYGMECHFNYAEKVVFATEGCVMSMPLEISKTSLYRKKKEVTTKEPVDKDVVRKYTMILQDQQTSQENRNKAILTLMEIKDTSTVPVLIAQVEGKYAFTVRQNAIRALGKIGDKRAVRPLLNILRKPVKGNIADEGEEEAIIRRTAVLALGEIGDVSALPVLETLAQDTKDYQSVRELAAITVAKIKTSENERNKARE